MKALTRSNLSKAVGLAGCLACLPAAAQVAESDNASWALEFTPYLWASVSPLRVDVGKRPSNGVEVPVSVFSTNLDFAIMGTLEARKGRWGALVDAQYVKLGVTGSQATATLTPFSNLDISYSQQIWTFAGLYRLTDGPVAVDLLGGARYLYAKTDTEFSTAFLPVTAGQERNKGWWDGIVGVRALVPIDAKWALLGYLDAGAGGSKFSYQAIVGANYAYSPQTVFKFGYRYFSFERDDAPVIKASLGGLYGGVGFRF
ncbi:outer membrane beta-barrel protein [Variovorax sp. YR216]|uniref:outer membrane beta-barrel protein n=1 Tax=Variovorax sp. YR216 TaxID=1882828 RepID=UPI00089CC83C|nr:outer membrane beta-barrel protein [Variovorax sp. YR216]SEB21919.1 Outer membrane protein beta-barrel domain-containing protein [Variovorax sp. YR216]